MSPPYCRRSGSGTEQRRSDAHHRSAFFRRDLVIQRHPHRKFHHLRKVLPQAVAQLAEPDEERPAVLGVGGDRRQRHQPRQLHALERRRPAARTRAPPPAARPSARRSGRPRSAPAGGGRRRRRGARAAPPSAARRGSARRRRWRPEVRRAGLQRPDEMPPGAGDRGARLAELLHVVVPDVRDARLDDPSRSRRRAPSSRRRRCAPRPRRARRGRMRPRSVRGSSRGARAPRLACRRSSAPRVGRHSRESTGTMERGRGGAVLRPRGGGRSPPSIRILPAPTTVGHAGLFGRQLFRKSGMSRSSSASKDTGSGAARREHVGLVVLQDRGAPALRRRRRGPAPRAAATDGSRMALRRGS